MEGWSQVLRICSYFVAITGCFCVYSLIQERLITVGFGPDEEVFEYSVFIVLVNRLVTCAVSASALACLGSPLRPAAPLALYAVPSVANVLGSTAQYEALKYVSFPLQALAKCAKSVPVMTWSLVTRTRRYTRNDYAAAAAVTLGCAVFVLAGDIRAPSLAAREGASPAALSYTTVGLALLAVFMVFDGLTCTSQDQLFANYDMHGCNQLLYTAAWSAALSALWLVGSGQLGAAAGFVARHPSSLWLMLAQSAVSTTVQLFIVFAIKQYGALNFALMMTLRQYLSIVLSCLVFQHSLTLAQWAGTLLVIAGLVGRSLDKAKHADLSMGAARAAKDAFSESEQLLRGSSNGHAQILPFVASMRSPATPRASSALQQGGAGGAAAMLRPLGNMLTSAAYTSPGKAVLLSQGSGSWKNKPG